MNIPNININFPSFGEMHGVWILEVGCILVEVDKQRSGLKRSCYQLNNYVPHELEHALLSSTSRGVPYYNSDSRGRLTIQPSSPCNVESLSPNRNVGMYSRVLSSEPGCPLFQEGHGDFLYVRNTADKPTRSQRPQGPTGCIRETR